MARLRISCLRRFASVVFAISVVASGQRAEAECKKSVADSLRVMTVNTGLTVYQPDIANDPADDVFGLENDVRAVEIANKIKAHDPDVVILNEVLDDAGAEALEDELKDLFPSHVTKIDDEWDSRLQDSGLMLFSKYPFRRFRSKQGEPDEGDGVETDGRAWVWVDGKERDDDENFVHRVIFEYRESDDHWAEKGAGLVRFKQECSTGGYSVAVAFSHTQSGYPDESLSDFHIQNWARIKNLRAIKWLVEDGLSDSERTADWLIVAGDLNVNGHSTTRTHSPFSPYVEEQYRSGVDGTGDIGSVYDSNAEGEPHSQWQHVFMNVGTGWESDDTQLKSFYSRGSSLDGTQTYSPSAESGALLIDAWGFETSIRDPGATNSGQTFGGAWLNLAPDRGERLDYILHNKPTDADRGQLCMQYIHKAIDFAQGPNGYLTDHAPLVADFNLPAPRCSLTKAGGNGVFFAEPVTFDPSDTSELYKVYEGFADRYCTGATKTALSCSADQRGKETGLSFGGSMQWYRLDTTPSGQPISLEIELVRQKCDPSKGESCVSFAVYHGSDLSTEMGAFEGKCKREAVNERLEDWKCKYLLEKPPYYVRVFFSGDPDRNVLARPSSGQPYDITFRRFGCRNKDDACFLPKHREIAQWWPAGPLDAQPSNCDADGDGTTSATEDGECRNTMWFRFTHENPPTLPQKPEFVWTSRHSSFGPGDNVIKGTVVEAAALAAVPLGTVSSGASGTSVGRAQPMTTDALPGLIVADKDVWEKPYYLKLTRYGTAVDDPDKYLNTKFETGVVFKTELTYHIPHTLHCIEERTDIGEDDVWQKVDGSGGCHPGNDTCFRWGDFDSPENEGGTVVSDPRQYGLYQKFGSGSGVGLFFEDVDDDEALTLSRLGANCPECSPIGFDATSWQPPDDDDPANIALQHVAYSDTFREEDREYRYEYDFYRSKKPKSCLGKGRGQLGDQPPCPDTLTCSNQGYCCVASSSGVCGDY